MQPTIEIINKVGEFLGEENIRWFAHVKGLKGRVDCILRLNYKRKHMPTHTIYLREGMQIRNFLRSLSECAGADFDSLWIDVINLLIILKKPYVQSGSYSSESKHPWPEDHNYAGYISTHESRRT